MFGTSQLRFEKQFSENVVCKISVFFPRFCLLDFDIHANASHCKKYNGKKKKSQGDNCVEGSENSEVARRM